MRSTVGLVLMFGGAFLIYEALAPSAHKVTTAAPPTSGSGGSRIMPDGSVGPAGPEGPTG